uniref:Uncharacterized protein n=1 Tax=Nelumbo nucifera TaxID=4432 RepID=A0A822Z315_NELNU|nr:TPA_asm: hypothetical protein HUJ06_008017 [Nelumbo nucifera]
MVGCLDKYTDMTGSLRGFQLLHTSMNVLWSCNALDI